MATMADLDELALVLPETEKSVADDGRPSYAVRGSHVRERLQPARMVRRRVVIRGLVQGVGFRFSTARAAEARGVAGWVRNRPDGTVEAVFEGEPDAVESLTRWAERGPRGAAVGRVEVAEEPAEGLRGFEIR